ncbi:MAG: DinB family protein [Dehalococcoidia bacterium]|nr:DinB family protein [Dehalococcoidia bacterium]
MDARDLLRRQFGFAHQLLEQTLDDVTPVSAAARQEGSTIGSIASIYGHAVAAEDAFVAGATENGMTVLQAGDWSDRTGIPVARPFQDDEWARLTVDLAAMREYARAVYEATDQFLATAPDEVIFREVDGPGRKVMLFPEVALTHTAQHWGEIAALKGIQGMKGLPF